MEIAKYNINDFSEGMSYEFSKTIILKDVDRFAEISGDISPLHMSDSFAQAKGYQGRVVHGALLTSYISQIIGVHFPGENCLLQNINIKFHAPCYINDKVNIKAQVVQVSQGANAVVLEVVVENSQTNVNLAKAKVQIAFSNNHQPTV